MGVAKPRVIGPALTPSAVHEADQVFGQAERRIARHGPFSERKRALAVVRCNQLESDNAGRCSWTTNIETTLGDAEVKSSRALAVHFAHAHPYMTTPQRRATVGRAWVNLRDVSGGL